MNKERAQLPCSLFFLKRNQLYSVYFFKLVYFREFMISRILKRGLLAPVVVRAYSMSGKQVPKVLVTRSDIPQKAIDLLHESCNVDIYPKPYPIPRKDLIERIKGKDALFCLLTEKINSELLDAAGPNLKVIGTMSVGFDHIDLEECKRRGIAVGNTPEVLTDAAAELTVALLLATSRRLVEAMRAVTDGGWKNCAWGPLWMCGATLTGSTVGIVGLGRIGFAVAERLNSFKPNRILYSGNSRKQHAEDKLGAKFVSFEDLIKESDFVVCCCSLNERTAGIFNKETFSKMKSSAIFINTSRGGVVNHDDLYDALKNGQIKAAGLDVTTPEPLPVDHKLTTLDNCVILPHIASATVETRTTMAVLTSRNILAGLQGKPLPCPL